LERRERKKRCGWEKKVGRLTSDRIPVFSTEMRLYKWNVGEMSVIVEYGLGIEGADRKVLKPQ